jgi:hypothetical protein
MRRLKILLFLFALSSTLMAAETLTFKIDNPRFVKRSFGVSGIKNSLEYDILVKATANGTYLYSSQIILYADASVFLSGIVPVVIKGPLASGQFDFLGGGLQDKYNIASSWNSGNINIAITSNPNSAGWPPASGAFNEVLTTYQVIGTIRIAINDAKIGSLAGIRIKASATDGYQKYATGVGPTWSAYYTSPNQYEGNDLNRVYVGRLYSSGSQWSQVNGDLAVVTNHWTSALNTTVWDTSATQVAAIDTALAKMGKLRIYPGAKLKINATMGLTCSDSTIIGQPKGLKILSGASGTGSFIDNGNISYLTSGTAEANLYLSGSRWHYVSSPVQGAVSQVFMNDYLRFYNEPGGAWGPYIVPVDVPLPVMKGFEVWVTGTGGVKSFTGSLNTGNKSFTVTRSAPGADNGYGWNLVGNPYPSAQEFGSEVSEGAGWTWPAGVSRTLYFLNYSGGVPQYAVYSWTLGTGTNGATSKIPPMQGYFVWVDEATSSGVISITNETRVHSNQAYWKSGQEEIRDNLLTLQAKGNGHSDDAIICFDEKASAAFSGDEDAFKLTNGSPIPNIFAYTSDSLDVSIDMLWFTGEHTLVPLGFTAGVSGTYELTAGNLESFAGDGTIFLEDLLDHTWVDLKASPVYLFNHDLNNDPHRFILHFMNQFVNVGDKTSAPLQVYSFGEYVYVRNSGDFLPGEVRVIDMLGRSVYRTTLENSIVSKYNPGVNSGYYVVRVISGGNVINQKVYLE